MKIEQKKWTKNNGWLDISDNNLKDKAQLVFIFGSSDILHDKIKYNEVRSFYPQSNLLFCSTAGEILDTGVQDDSIVLTAVYFEKTNIKFSEVKNTVSDESYANGKKLIEGLPKEGLAHVMVFSEGLKVNGSNLVKGIHEALPANVAATGGLVGDGARFKQTLVGLNGIPREGKIVAIGFYGKDIKIGYGSLGGWDAFGPERLITRSKENILYELDDKPALRLYKEYLGDLAGGLPLTGLLFPLNLKIQTELGDTEVVRTILSVNEEDQSMTFAGNMPEGSQARLMKANFDRLIDGAGGAAMIGKKKLQNNIPDLAILISCIGRKLVLKERIEEEVEAVRDIFGKKTAITGFYSYGEISPAEPTEPQCSLHNQTMTVTIFME
jgi:hypothetical protein